jgi:hypothetical protein
MPKKKGDANRAGDVYEVWLWSARNDFIASLVHAYEGVSKSFRTGHLERELQMVELSATRRSCIGILWISLVSFAAITLCVDSQRLFIVLVVYFFIDSLRKLLDIRSYLNLTERDHLRSTPPPLQKRLAQRCCHCSELLLWKSFQCRHILFWGGGGVLCNIPKSLKTLLLETAKSGE